MNGLLLVAALKDKGLTRSTVTWAVTSRNHWKASLPMFQDTLAVSPQQERVLLLQRLFCCFVKLPCCFRKRGSLSSVEPDRILIVAPEHGPWLLKSLRVPMIVKYLRIHLKDC